MVDMHKRRRQPETERTASSGSSSPTESGLRRRRQRLVRGKELMHRTPTDEADPSDDEE